MEGPTFPVVVLPGHGHQAGISPQPVPTQASPIALPGGAQRPAGSVAGVPHSPSRPMSEANVLLARSGPQRESIAWSKLQLHRLGLCLGVPIQLQAIRVRDLGEAPTLAAPSEAPSEHGTPVLSMDAHLQTSGKASVPCIQFSRHTKFVSERYSQSVVILLRRNGYGPGGGCPKQSLRPRSFLMPDPNPSGVQLRANIQAGAPRLQ